MFTLEVSRRVATFTLDSPPRNVLTAELQRALAAEVAALNRRADHNLLVIASGLEVFSAGADVAEHATREQAEPMLRAAHGLIEALLRSPVPTLAAVNGACLGGAFELVLACDRVLARADAPCGLPEITLGCYPPAGLVLGAQKLAPALLAELVTTGARLPASEISARGAGWRIVPADGFPAALAESREAGLATPRGPLEEATRLLRCGAAERFRAAIEPLERAYLERLLALSDALEGPRAFLEKRPARWIHDLPGR
jgi:cyclohexa-1,5-dienecarbonyl-CoA hydratase